MDTSYIYSSTRLNTLGNELLTRTDIDRLLTETDIAGVHEALKETYLAHYLLEAPGESVADAIEAALVEAKELIVRIIPQAGKFALLWLQYDIHNLRVFAKAKALGMNYDLIEPNLSYRGMYDPAYLYSYVESNTLNRLQADWQTVFDQALRLVANGEREKVDEVFDQLFFTTGKQLVTDSNDQFLRKYFKAVIDLANIKARLRILTHQELKREITFIEGGNFALSELESKEQIFSAVRSLGGEGWVAALEYYQATGNTTRLDARMDEYLIEIAAQASYDIFSPASIVFYYLQCRQSAANIRTIMVGKETAMPNDEIRTNLRMSHVNN